MSAVCLLSVSQILLFNFDCWIQLFVYIFLTAFCYNLTAVCLQFYNLQWLLSIWQLFCLHFDIWFFTIWQLFVYNLHLFSNNLKIRAIHDLTEKLCLFLMCLHMLSKIAFVKGSKPTYFARIITFFAHMLAQNVSLEMVNGSELGTTVSTSVLFDQFCHIVYFGFVKDKSIGCAGLVLTSITEK